MNELDQFVQYMVDCRGYSSEDAMEIWENEGGIKFLTPDEREEYEEYNCEESDILPNDR